LGLKECEDWIEQLATGTMLYQSSDDAEFRFHVPYLLPGCMANEDVPAGEAWHRFRRFSAQDALICLWVQEDPAGAYEFIGTHILTEQSRAFGCVIIHPLPCMSGLYWLRVVHRHTAKYQWFGGGSALHAILDDTGHHLWPQTGRRDWRRLDAYVRRQQLLEEMSKNYALATPFNEYFKHVFVDD
ncbi:hypothetical protein SYNPS1DRAFT_23032, partial [Syncephalis pseudoplumigaleata]